MDLLTPMSRKRRKRTSKIASQTPRTHGVRHAPMRRVELVDDVLKGKTEFRSYKKPSEKLQRRRRLDLRSVEDLRHVNPDKTFRTRSGRLAETVNRPQGHVQKSRLSAPVRTYFKQPDKVVVCIRRDTRRRVLFAMQTAGRGKRTSTVHHFSEQSKIRCKE